MSHSKNDRDVNERAKGYIHAVRRILHNPGDPFRTRDKTHTSCECDKQVSSSGIHADVIVVLEVRQSIALFVIKLCHYYCC